MYRLMFSILFIVICWKWGDWKNYKKYYPTILYLILWDLLYEYTYHDHPLWKFQDLLIGNFLSDLLFKFVIYPCTVMVYLFRFPKAKIVQAIYVALWAFFYFSIEYIASRLDLFHYYNGWNYLWSFGFDLTIFIMLVFHFKKPLPAWAVSFGLLSVILMIFHIPLK